MSRQRLAFAWIACFAVLFNMLAMSTTMAGAMSSAVGGASNGQVLWSTFCTSSGPKMVAVSIGTLEQPAPQNDDHSSMQHCWCCSGSPSLVALPGHVPQLYFTRFAPVQNRPELVLQLPTPRQQWPSLNPRASPVV